MLSTGEINLPKTCQLYDKNKQIRKKENSAGYSCLAIETLFEHELFGFPADETDVLNPLLSLYLRFDLFQICHLMRVVAMTTATIGAKICL
jgi:hypothetical protein